MIYHGLAETSGISFYARAVITSKVVVTTSAIVTLIRFAVINNDVTYLSFVSFVTRARESSTAAFTRSMNARVAGTKINFGLTVGPCIRQRTRARITVEFRNTCSVLSTWPREAKVNLFLAFLTGKSRNACACVTIDNWCARGVVQTRIGQTEVNHVFASMPCVAYLAQAEKANRGAVTDAMFTRIHSAVINKFVAVFSNNTRWTRAIVIVAMWVTHPAVSTRGRQAC